MDLASYYQGLFVQSSAAQNVDNSSTFFTPLSPNPCWDLDSLHDEELYRFPNTNYNGSYCKSSPLNSSSDLSETCSPTRSSATIGTVSDSVMCFSKSYLQNHFPLPSHSTENGSTLIDDGSVSTMSLTGTSTKEEPGSKKTGTRSRSKANARERKRMNRINVGFRELRLKLPGRSSHRELSKIEALQVAHSYILQLATILQSTPV